MLTSVMAEWFYGKDNTQHGPVSEQDIHSLASSGQIDTNTIIWREGMTDWIPMKDVPEFQSLASSAAGDLTQAQPSPYVAPPGQAYAAAVPTDGLAIASLVCGILAIISCYVWGLFGLAAVICGHMSLKKIRNSATPLGGRGMSIAGLITGYIGIAFQLLMIVGLIFAFASASASPTYTP